ncbi:MULTISPECIES: AEC family transporter [unclassified Corynebacterium]|uniref:AEC family transporter n=1 Tax=unclassified Corynebacterium TaxID=2624378 RepID=UPI0029CA6A6C|nr:MULTISPECIES: AEC family transporter [unclassified Corynebacterium]WPF66430.1 AEC family transporter [Corynebacterium sp. 22KM0430]WPF68920.1 AEC family transporter [Corynebacterium sp. 21KM1197]
MIGVITGFAIIMVVIAVGYVLGRIKIIPPGEARLMLNRVAFYAATPALLFTVVSTSPPQALFSPVIAVSLLATLLTGAVFLVVARVLPGRQQHSAADTAMGAAAASYVNSNNIGLPVSMYVLGSAAYIPPILVIQMALLTPLLLSVLGASGAGGGSHGSTTRAVLGAIRTALLSPIVLASVAGLVVCLTSITVPEPVMAPLEILGGASIPMILMSFGASLNTTTVLDSPKDRSRVLLATGLKTLVMPLLAWLLTLGLGLEGEERYAAIILAALPTAQNVYNYAATFQKGTIVARDTVLLTTFTSLPVMLTIAVLSGR